MPPDKALGADGFNGQFLKSCWNVIKEDIYKLCFDFFDGKLNLESVNMDMARGQDLAFKGSAKLSGACGRLMCCLSYEADLYKDLKKKLPEIGSFVKIKDTNQEGKGKVIDQNVLKQEVVVELESGAEVIASIKNLKRI